MVAANFDSAIVRQADDKRRSLYTGRHNILNEVLQAWMPAFEKYDELVVNLQAATSLTMDARADQPPAEAPNYAITSELMSKMLRTAAGARGNFLIGDAETPTIAARVILESLIDMKVILTDGTGELAKRFFYYSLYDLLNRTDGDLGGKRPDLQKALAMAEQTHTDLSAWAFIGGKKYKSVASRAEKMGMKDDYDGLYRKLSNTVHSSLMGMREFEPHGHYILGSTAQLMHRPVVLIPSYLIQAFDEYRRSNKITVPNEAYYLRHFAVKNLREIMSSIPEGCVPENELEVLKGAIHGTLG